MTGLDHHHSSRPERQGDTTASAAIFSDDASLCALIQHILAISHSPRFHLTSVNRLQFDTVASVSANLFLLDTRFNSGQYTALAQAIKSHHPDSRLVLLLSDDDLLAMAPALANLARQSVDQFLLKSDLCLRQILASLNQTQTPSQRPPVTQDTSLTAAYSQATSNSFSAGVQAESAPANTAITPSDTALPRANSDAINHSLAIDLENQRVHINALALSPLCSETDTLLSLDEWYGRLEQHSATEFRTLLESAQKYQPVAKQLPLQILDSNGQTQSATLTDIQLKNNGQGRVIGASAQLLLQIGEHAVANEQSHHPDGFDNLPNSSELIAQDRLWQNVATSLPMLCLLLDEQGYIVRVINSGDIGQQLPKDLTPGIKVADALDIESLDALGETISRTLNTGKSWQQTIAFPSEHGLRWLDTHITKLRGTSGLSRQVVWTAFDITANRHDYQELLKNHDALAQILEDAPILFFQKDNAGRYMRVNNAFCDLFNLRADVIAGRNDKEVFRDWDTGFINVSERALNNPDQQGVNEISYQEALHGTEQLFHWRTLTQKRQGDNQIEFICGFGIARPVGENTHDQTVAPVHELHTGTGIAMSGALKQDFKTILNSLVNYAELALSQKNQSRTANIADYLAQVETTARRTRELMHAKSGDNDNANNGLLLKPIIEATVDMLRPTLPGSLEFDTVYASSEAKALVDEASIKKIVMLLLLNAKSTAETATTRRSEDQKIRLTLETSTLQNNHCVACTEALGNDYISLTVQTTADIDDTGLSRLINAAKQSTLTNSDSNVIALTHRVGGHAMIHYANGLLSLQLLFSKA